jgi:hypothetical protein
MMRTASSLLLFIAAGLACSCPPRAGAALDSVADFYRGRQLTVVVGYGPGGSASFYAQALAHHMGRFLPGSPSLVVQHMPGAGGLLAANNIFNTAPRDGTVFAITGRTMAIEPLIGNSNAKFDGRKFSWLGTANVETTTCLAWRTSPVKTLQDAMTQELVVGGTGADATEVIFPKAVNKLVGTRFKIVIGYQSSADMNLAMERGELAGNCGLGWTIVKRRLPDWLTDNKISILFQMGLRKHPDIPAVPLISDFANGTAVLCPARRSGRACPGATRRVRTNPEGCAVPGRGEPAGARGPGRQRRGHRSAARASLCDAQERDRARQGDCRITARVFPAQRTRTGAPQARVRLLRRKIALHAPLGGPGAGTSSARSLAPPTATARCSRQAASAVGLLIAGRNADPDGAARCNVSLERDRLAARIEDLAILDLHTSAVGAVASADLGLDENAPIAVEGARPTPRSCGRDTCE